ncbi:MAG: IS1634 family transposase [Bacteroidales bacterium]|nr:IS1634 family transposase [Bacteroidales bacterium]
MYFRVSLRHNPVTGKHSGYYRLVESYRNTLGRVCHRTILSVGFLDGLRTDELNRIQKGLNERVQGLGNELFAHDCDPRIQAYVDDIYEQIVAKQRLDIHRKPSQTKDWQTIDMNSVRNKNVREVGAEWLCYQAIRQLGIDTFLENRDWDDDDVSLAMTHLISRAVYPASELKTSRWIKENSAVCELTGFEINRITKDALYRISHKLFAEKEALEKHLSCRTNELFDLQDKIMLFDLTNTYFEGEKLHSSLARYGRSKEKRNDAKLVVLALVINPEGFIKYSTLFQGNKSDSTTLPHIIEKLRKATSTGAGKALVVIDAGIATQDNLKLISEKGYDYLCVSRSTLKEYTVNSANNQVVIHDKKHRTIELCHVQANESTDYFLRVKSQGKEHKERSMNSLFKDRFEEGLQSIQNSLSKKGGVKKLEKVHERIGRLKQKYPSIHRYYQIDITSNEKNIVTSISWELKPITDPDHTSGIYFLRTSILPENEIIVWTFYNIIREVENTFRTLKTDIDLRPIFHQNDDATMAHLHLGLLAYWLVNTIRHQLKKADIRSGWSEIVRIMNTQKCLTTIAQNKHDEIINIRRCSEPEEKVKLIYTALKYKHAPFTRKKSVVLKPTPKKILSPQNKSIIRI